MKMHRQLGFVIAACTALRPAQAQCGEAKLVAPDPSEYAQFGITHVGRRGIFVGAPLANGMAQDAGAVYVFECAGQAWNLLQEIEAPTPAPNMDFGHPVGGLDDTLVIGAGGDSSTTGAAYVLGLTTLGWKHVQRVVASDGKSGDSFGSACAIQGNRLVLGAPGYAFGSCVAAGKAYIFEHTASGWQETAWLRPDSVVCGAYFSATIGIDGNTIVIGSPNLDQCVVPDSGTAYVFEPSSSGWVLTAQLCAPDAATGDGFARSLSLSADTIAVGAPWTGPNLIGKVYIFERGETGWEYVQTLFNPLQGNGHTSFGDWLQLHGNRLLIGAPATKIQNIRKGAAWVFERTSSGWEPTELLSADDGVYGDAFGIRLAFEGSIAAIGAAGHDTGGFEYAGAAYVFEIGPGGRYCEAATNSLGVGARIDASGSTSIVANDLRLWAGPVPPRQIGIFFLGSGQTQLPFGNGWRCVNGTVMRLFPTRAVGTVLFQDVDNSLQPFAGMLIAGSQWNVQAWYRDPAAGGAVFSTTDALTLLFQP